MNVTLRQLRAFVAVAHSGSFTKAAASLHITQSALSGLIKELELALGVQVVQRSTRKVQLSDVGAEFLPLSARILQDLDGALQAIADLKSLKSGVVRVAVPQLLACTLMPEVVGAFAKEHPGVDVRISDCVVEGVLSKVQSGEVDFGLGPERSASQGIAARLLFDMPFVAVFPAAHPLSACKRVTWKDILRYPLISLQGEYTQMLRADLQSASVGLAFNPTSEVAFMTTAISMVSAGLGVTTCLPYAQSLIKQYGLQTRALTMPTVRRDFHVLTKSDRVLSPAAQAFAEFLVCYVEQQKWVMSPQRPSADQARARRQRPSAASRKPLPVV